MRRLILVILLLAVVASKPVVTQSQDSGTQNPLLEACRNFDNGNDTQNALCITFMDGFFEGYGFGGGDEICPPEHSDLNQSALVVSKYLKDNPDKLHLGLGALTYEVLSDKFPCHKKQIQRK